MNVYFSLRNLLNLFNIRKVLVKIRFVDDVGIIIKFVCIILYLCNYLIIFVEI